MSEERPSDFALVIAYDGTVFYCHVEYCHVEGISTTAPQRQWIYETTSARYEGPPFLGPLTLDKLRDAVNAWWYGKTNFGQDPE